MHISRSVCARAYRRIVFIPSTSGETENSISRTVFAFFFLVFVVYSLLAAVGGGRHSTSRVSDGRSRTGTTATVVADRRCSWWSSSSLLPLLLLLITVGHRDGGDGVVGSRPVHERLANRNAACPIFSSRYNSYTHTLTLGDDGTTSTFFQARRGWRVTQRRGYLGPNARAHARIPGFRESYTRSRPRPSPPPLGRWNGRREEYGTPRRVGGTPVAAAAAADRAP